MKIESAQFIRGVTGTNDILDNGIPQIAFIGRSNAGKSSVINSLANREIARTSSFPGLTQQINLFLINGVFYLVDLPGYGYAKTYQKQREKLKALINWYFFVSDYEQKKVIVIIDAEVGPTKDDLEMIYSLEDHGKNIIVVANKIDKIKKSEYDQQFIKIRELIGVHKVIPYSAKKKIGVNDLLKEMLQ
jgi:GTP-binding protein